ncbi:MAG: DUF6485 family protein [Candidatus Kapabacteria bacterium]|nr:DUF6485 family protein [Candidatus Kapabacteria bacterium]
MECKKDRNKREFCNCTKTECPRSGVCCECISRHLAKRQLPACCFPKGTSAPERSFESFAEMVNNGRI